MKSTGIVAHYTGWLSEKKLSRIMLIVGGVLALAMVVGLLSFHLVQDMLASGTFPDGVSIVGVDVAGLTKAEAVEKCKDELAEIANRPLALIIDDETYQITPEEIGLKLEYEKMVDNAFEEAWQVNIFERMARRFMNRPKRINVSLMTEKNDEMVRVFVENAMGMINREPEDAYVDVTTGVPVIVPAKDGRQADFEELLADTSEALGTPERTVFVNVTRTPAAVPDSVFSKMIIINLAQHSLSLYNREELLAQFPIACGSATWPTPAGIWKIVSKQRNPSWTNPGTSWAKSMPPYIPPGPGNPLGTRALALNASGVLIHGTYSSGSIGYSVSHGCIRMYLKDVEQLFEMVEVNTPVYIIKAPGNPGFDVTKKPFWQK